MKNQFEKRDIQYWYVHSLLWERFKTTNDGSEPHLAQIMNIKAD